MTPLKKSHNIAARMGRWSASHRKIAIFGWLAFVIASFVIGGAVGTKSLEDGDTNVGEARKADKVIDAAFPNRADEQTEFVLVQSKALKTTDPAFKAAIEDATKTLDGFPEVRKLQSPLDVGHSDQISKDGRSVIAAFVPLLLALTAVMATTGLVSLPSQIVPMDENVSAVVLLIGLAVGVDYSLFYLRREREERA